MEQKEEAQLGRTSKNAEAPSRTTLTLLDSPEEERNKEPVTHLILMLTLFWQRNHINQDKVFIGTAKDYECIDFMRRIWEVHGKICE